MHKIMNSTTMLCHCQLTMLSTQFPRPSIQGCHRSGNGHGKMGILQGQRKPGNVSLVMKNWHFEEMSEKIEIT